MEEKDNILEILQFFGDSVVGDMRALIELNGSIATGRLLENIKVTANKTQDIYTLVISYPFYGKFVDEGRKPGKMPPIEDIKKWTRLKGIPESAAFPIAKKIGEKGYKGIHFTEPFYDDIKVIKELLTDNYSSYVVKELTKDFKK